ncbi:Spermidine synthase [Minicystis rosea]|nr:Spermidine synthase [Minicystis rosea]
MRSRFPLVATLFLISGATGLLYEVAFSKLLGYVFGATAYAVSTVLSAFMAGLALGAHFGGRNAARVSRPLMAYGAAEMIVGLVCAASPAALAWITHAYVSLARSAPGSLATVTIARAALTAMVVLVPTVAMGATLPLLSRVVAGVREGEGSAARLAGIYAINTAGGAAGALLSAYVILPVLGIRGTMMAAALANVAIGAVAFFTGRASAAEPSHPARVVEAAPDGAKAEARGTSDDSSLETLLLGIAFASGYLVFAAEVVETHLLALLIGNSAYAFGLMLAVFLVCLAIGAARAPAFAAKHGSGALAHGLAAAALSLAITLPLWDQLPRIFTFAGKHIASWGGREACRAIVAFAILALPTLWMGTTFPLLLQRVAGRPDVAARVGGLTVANTLGTIAGSILTGYVVLPALGSQGALRAVAVAFAIAAAAASFRLVEHRSRALTVGGLAIVIALLLPRWDMARLTSGANVYFTTGPPPDSIEMVREDVHGGVTTVVRRAGVTTMYTNGKFQGDDGPEMPAQRRFAHFPSLFVRSFDRALVIGLGTGTTLGTIATYPWKHVDVAEISPSIVEASRRYFGPQTLGALDDPRVRLDLNDGRNVLLVAAEPYDLVTIELTSVWFAGASSLYSREFYDLVRSRLAPGGVLQQWVQLHHIRRRELAAIVHTLRGAFGHVALFVGGEQGILVASDAPLVASSARLAELAQRPSLKMTLAGKAMTDLFDELLASETELDRFVAESKGEDGDVLLSTDDNLYLEYATPKGNVLNYHTSLDATLAMLGRYRTNDPKARHLAP